MTKDILSNNEILESLVFLKDEKFGDYFSTIAGKAIFIIVVSSITKKIPKHMAHVNDNFFNIISFL